MKVVLYFVLCLINFAAFAIDVDDPYSWLEKSDDPSAINWARDHSIDKRCSLLLNGPGSTYQAYLQRLKALPSTPRNEALPVIIGDRAFVLVAVNGKSGRALMSYSVPHFDGTKGKDQKTVFTVNNLDTDSIALFTIDPQGQYALLHVNKSGSEESEVVEVDLQKGGLTKDGFHLPFGQNHIVYLDKNTVLFSSGTFGKTQEGSPDRAFVLRRGQSIDQRMPAFERTEEKTIAVQVESGFDGKNNFAFVVEWQGFNEKIVHQVDVKTYQVHKLKIPYNLNFRTAESSFGIIDGHMVFINHMPVDLNGQKVPAGSLLAYNLRTSSSVKIIWQPESGETLQDFRILRSGIVINRLKNISSMPLFAHIDSGFNVSKMTEIPIPEKGIIMGYAPNGENASSFAAHRLIFKYASFLQPNTYFLFDGQSQTLTEIGRQPTAFDSSSMRVIQRFATSSDGTKIPYFLIGPRHLTGKTPTLIVAYGAYGMSQTPYYLSGIGNTWLQDGNVYVVANVRGGGELGPDWHSAVTGANVTKRNLTSDDINSVAEDLIRRGVTAPEYLGAIGRSAGGTTVSSAVFKRPDLYAAAAFISPVFDSIRTEALRSGKNKREFGEPLVADQLAHLYRYLAYYNVSPRQVGTHFPKFFIYTSTTDDTALPGHARKMAAKLMDNGYDVVFEEAAGGGHAASTVEHERDAKMLTFFKEKLQR